MKKYLKHHAKKILLGFLGLFSLAISVSPILTPTNILEIYMGVMSEEVSPMLKSSLSVNKTHGSTLVISRSNIRPKKFGGTGELFEQDLSLYSQDLEHINNISVTTDSNFESINHESDIVRQLTKKIKEKTSKKVIDIEAHLVPGLKSKMTKFIDKDGQAIISVAKIGSGRIERIFIQLPEMGFQASLCYQYGVAILDAICECFTSEKIMFTTTFAGGGSISTDIKPGTTANFTNSIGIRVYKVPGKNEYIGKILISNADEEFTLFQTDPCKNQYYALELARFVFLKLGHIKYKLNSTYINNVISQQNQDNNRPITDIEKEIEQNIINNVEQLDIDFLRYQLIKKLKNGSTSIAGSIFLGELEKEAGNNIGKMIAANNSEKDFSTNNNMMAINNNKIDFYQYSNTAVISANMEDDIIFKMYNHIAYDIKKNYSYSYTLLRTACDPFRISKGVKKQLQEWTQKAEYTLDSYVDAVLWRFSGFDNSFLTKNAHWTFYDSFKNTPNSVLFYKTKMHMADGEQIVIDPFWREIGTDFITDVLEIGEEKNDLDNIREEFKNILLVKKPNHLNNESNEILTIKKKLETVLVKSLDNLHLNKADGKYQVWIRKGSWANNIGNQLNSVDFIHSANADRAFYVSTNVIALIENAENYFKNLIEKQKFLIL